MRSLNVMKRFPRLLSSEVFSSLSELSKCSSAFQVRSFSSEVGDPLTLDQSAEPVSLVQPNKPKSARPQSQKFIDALVSTLVGGKGGDGCTSFMSQSRMEWMGPDGGDGGNGGHVILKASLRRSSLAGLGHTVKAEDGINGANYDKHGKNALHTVVEVPVGTVVMDYATGEVLHELMHAGQTVVVARGGAGGKGNHFYLTNECRAPMIAQKGADGTLLRARVEMSVIADVGLVGFPNAGKSTLLRVLSRARPRAAAYPFTTLRPHVGIATFSDGARLRVADTPGLIDGASEGRGLGVQFLRHVCRCPCLAFLIDTRASENPVERLATLRRELEAYQPGLSRRPHVVVANKMDMDESEEGLELLNEAVGLGSKSVRTERYAQGEINLSNLPGEVMTGLPEYPPVEVISVSALHGTNIDFLAGRLRSLYEKYAQFGNEKGHNSGKAAES